MTTTARANLIVPEILVDAIKGAYAGMRVFAGSPAVIMNSSLPQENRGGDTVKVPFFASMGEMEDVTEGNSLTPALISMTSETESILHSGLAFELTQWAQMAAAFADPYAEAGRQVAEAFLRRIDKGLIDVAVASGLATGMTSDVFNATTPATITYNRVVDAEAAFGDEMDGIAMLAVHSKVYSDLQKLVGISSGVPLLTPPTANDVARVAGIPVVRTDRLIPDMTSVTSAGTTPPTVTVTGTALVGIKQLTVSITTGGARGTAVFKWSIDGGLTYTTGVTTAATNALAGTGLTLNFATGTNYSTDNVYTVNPKFTSVLAKRGALVCWYNGNPTAEVYRDVLKDSTVVGTHTYWCAHRYSRLPGSSKAGIALLKTN